LGYLTAQMSRTIGVTFAAAAAFAAVVPASAAGSVFATVSTPSLLRGGPVAGTHYGGGAAYKGNRSANPVFSLAVKPNGQIVGRAAQAINCHGQSWNPLYVRLAGTAQGAAISVSGRTRVPGLGYLRISLTGTADGQAATGTVSVREPRRCKHWSFPFVLHTDSAPAGPPAVPGLAMFTGLTSQSAGGVRLPISVSTTHTGKVWAQWDALLSCHPGSYAMSNLSPLTKIRPDGTFTRSERFTIRYRGGYKNHYRVTFAGAFHSDGVSGTLKARMLTTKPGRRYRPCVSGTQTWAARG